MGYQIGYESDISKDRGQVPQSSYPQTASSMGIFAMKGTAEKICKKGIQRREKQF